MIVLLAIALLISVVIIGVPIPFAFVISSLFIVIFAGYDPSFLIPHGFSSINSVVVLAIPLFVMAGSLINHGGIGEKLVSTVERVVGKVKGGLGVVTVISCAIFGGISGSAAATTSCIGGILAPKLIEKGYSPGYTAALISNSGLLGMLIPPSSIMILYAWLANVSVLATFLAGIIPGIILIILFSTINIILLKNNPNVKAYTNEELKEMNEKIKKSKGWGSGPAMLMPIIVLGSIYAGMFTPTEAAAVSVAYAILVGMFIYKKLDAKTLKTALVESSVMTGSIMVMLFTVMILSRLYIMESLPQNILGFLTGISESPLIIILIVNVFVLLLGMIMDDISAILLITPLLLPVVTAIGIDPIHFAAILCVNLGVANITPPTAPVLYLGGKIAGAELKEMLSPTLIFIFFAWFPTLLIVTFLPEIALFLPKLLLGLK